MGGFRAQVVDSSRIFNHPDGGAQHAVEIPWLGKITLGSAIGAGDISEAIYRILAVLFLIGLDQLIRAPALVAFLAFGQRVDEGIDVARCLPDLRRQDDRGIKAHDIVTAAHHVLPPLPADIVLQFYAIGAVIPSRSSSTINLRGLENEPTPFAQIDYGFNTIGGHKALLLERGARSTPAGCRRTTEV